MSDENTYEIPTHQAVNLLHQHLKSICRKSDKHTSHVIHNDADRHQNWAFTGTTFLQHQHWKDFDPDDEHESTGNNQPVRIKTSTCGGYGLEITLIPYKDPYELGAYDSESAYFDWDLNKWCRVTDGFSDLMNLIDQAATEYPEWAEDMPMYI